jgi:phage terminase large subunit-like protein
MTAMMTTPASSVQTAADLCPGCGWKPKSGEQWPTFGRIAVRWIEENLIFAEGDSFGKPVRLRADQKAFLWRFYEYCPSCDWWHYDEALRGEARGGGKTALIAMIACLEFGGPPQIAPYSPNVVVAAASWDQANLLYSAAATMLGGRDQEVEQAPLRGFFEVYDAQITFADNRPGRLFRTATVAGTNQGGQPTLFIADEIHEFGDVGDSRARFHTVVAMGTKKRTLTYRIPGPDGAVREVTRGSGRAINLSTAGFDVDHSFLGSIYKRGMREAQQQDATRFLFDWSQAPDDIDYTDPAQRAAACRAASGAADVIWSVAARVAEWDKDHVLHHEWIRYYANRWVDVAEESWLSEHPGAWAACKGTWEIVGDEAAVLAIDMALKRDSVAVAEVRLLPGDERHPDGRYAVTARIWYPVSGSIPHLEVFEYIEQRAAALGTAFRGLAYDPRYFQLPAEQLEESGQLVIQFDQSPQRMAPACGLTYDLILSGGIVHDGDVELATQIKSAVRKQWERGFTLSKGKSKRHIDAAVATCIGVWTLAELAGQNEPSVLDQIW